MAPVSVTSPHSQIVWLASQNTLKPFLPVSYFVRSQENPYMVSTKQEAESMAGEAESMAGKADHLSSVVSCAIMLAKYPLL